MVMRPHRGHSRVQRSYLKYGSHPPPHMCPMHRPPPMVNLACEECPETSGSRCSTSSNAKSSPSSKEGKSTHTFSGEPLSLSYSQARPCGLFCRTYYTHLPSEPSTARPPRMSDQNFCPRSSCPLASLLFINLFFDHSFYFPIHLSSSCDDVEDARADTFNDLVNLPSSCRLIDSSSKLAAPP